MKLIDLKESELKKLSSNTVYQIMEDDQYNRKTRAFAAIEFLSREKNRVKSNKLKGK